MNKGKITPILNVAVIINPLVNYSHDSIKQIKYLEVKKICSHKFT